MKNVKVRRKDLIKNRKDKRYVEKQGRLEQAIGKFLKLGWLTRLKASEVSNEADVWTTTFYDHYIHMDEAVNSFFHKMEPELKTLAGEVSEMRREANLEIVFFKIFYFVYQNRDYYSVIIGQGYSQALMRIADPFRPVLKQGWSNYGTETEEKGFCLLSWELGGALYYWGSFENFDYNRMSYYVKKMARLAKNTTKRLVET